MRQSKELDFPESACILRELCTFHSATDSFVYTAPKQHPNALFKFTHNANLDAKQLLSVGFTHQTQIQPTSAFQEYLFTELFGGSQLLENLKPKWERILEFSKEDAEIR